MSTDVFSAIVAKAWARTGREGKVDRGFNWQCYCVVCSDLRKHLREAPAGRAFVRPGR